MDTALDAGINYFDTANVYSWGENKGRTESIIGNWFAKGGKRRDKVVLATKVYGNMAADGEAWPNHERLSAVNIRLPLLVGEMPPARHDRLPTGSAFQADPVRQPVRTARLDNWCPVVGSAGP